MTLTAKGMVDYFPMVLLNRHIDKTFYDLTGDIQQWIDTGDLSPEQCPTTGERAGDSHSTEEYGWPTPVVQVTASYDITSIWFILNYLYVLHMTYIFIMDYGLLLSLFNVEIGRS